MRNTPSSWFERHSLALYFILTYVISWTIWSPIILSARDGRMAVPLACITLALLSNDCR